MKLNNFDDIKNDMDRYDSAEAISMRKNLADLREELAKKSFELHTLDKVYKKALENYQIYVGLIKSKEEESDGSSV